MQTKKAAAAERLSALRRELQSRGIDAVIVPTADPHLSEYVPDHWKQREALTGFAGSAGTLYAGRTAAAMETDSRYWEQASAELIDGIELLRWTPEHRSVGMDWLAAHLRAGAKVLADPAVMSVENAEALESALAAMGFELVLEPIDWTTIWTDRPAVPASKIRSLRHLGEPTAERLARIRRYVAQIDASATLLTALDDVAWATNLRGADVPNNPVFLSNLLITADDAVLFVDAARLDESAAEALAAAGIRTAPPSALAQEVRSTAAAGLVAVDPSHAPMSVLEVLDAERVLWQTPGPVADMKQRKTPAEIEGFRAAHLRDAVALAEFYAELDEALAAGRELTESDVVAMLGAKRREQKEFIEESFPTIAAFGPNAALPHYQPPETGGARLADGLLLIDSGGQYECGTTDVTRMTAVGEVTPAARHDATIVTRAMLRLMTMRFPENLGCDRLDAAARMGLWAEGLDFGHGTGHGVGYVLNVHEGPVRISPMVRTPMPVGAVVSDEPGVYRPGVSGVRVENLLACVPAGQTPFGRFLAFEPLTLCPIDVRTLEEPFGEMRDELNAFNAMCAAALEPLVSERARAWLRRAARPIR